MRNVWLLAALAGICGLFNGCETTPEEQLQPAGKTQLEQRQIQSRVYDTTERERTLQAVMSTLQDFDFVIDKANETLGTVTATKLQPFGWFNDNGTFRMAVSVRPHGEKQLIVEVSAQYMSEHDGSLKIDPGSYQRFFDVLDKNLFLEGPQADNTGP